MKQQRSDLDLDEIATNTFVVHNPMIRSMLKGEGIISGQMFELTTWRRDGLIARLRMREFKVRTLTDHIAELPGLPSDPPLIGELGWRPLASRIERFSRFDLDALRWTPLTPEEQRGTPGLSIYSGTMLRRRKGRGSATYYIALIERNGTIGLQPIAETGALLMGYAQAREYDDRALLAERHDDTVVLPNIQLPAPHRVLLERIATSTDAGLSVDERGWPLAQALFARLGIQLNIQD